MSAASAADVAPMSPRIPVAGKAADIATEPSPARNLRRPTKESARTGYPLRIDSVLSLVSEGLSLEQGLGAHTKATRQGEARNAVPDTRRIRHLVRDGECKHQDGTRRRAAGGACRLRLLCRRGCLSGDRKSTRLNPVTNAHTV